MDCQENDRICYFDFEGLCKRWPPNKDRAHANVDRAARGSVGPTATICVSLQLLTVTVARISLQPMAEAAQIAVGGPAHPINVVADAGYSNGEQAEACEAKGILPHVPASRGVNNHGDGTLFDRTEFTYQPKSDTFRCPAGQTLARKQLSRKDRMAYYAGQPEVCGSCALKSRCTTSPRRIVSRHLHEEALQRMQRRATPEAMQLRRSIVEHPFANLKYRIFGNPRFLLSGLRGAQTEISLGVTAYNLKRMLNILGGHRLSAALESA